MKRKPGRFKCQKVTAHAQGVVYYLGFIRPYQLIIMIDSADQSKRRAL
jgi:hypothetical protein